MNIYIKKLVLYCLIFALTLLSGCAERSNGASSLAKNKESAFSVDTATEKDNKNLYKSSTSSANVVSDKKAESENATSPEANEEAVSSESKIKVPDVDFKAIWISYYELPFWGNTLQKAKQKFADMMKTVKNQGYTAVFCHVRANADAFYPSKYFPFAMQLTGEAGKNPGYDPLKIMTWAAKKYGLEFHAWINPYRVSNITSNPDDLAKGHIAAKWLADGSNRAVVHNNGIYFNPSSTDVQKLILNGIREILEKYNVDGIHFDDYFYPTGISDDFDAKLYEKYKNTTSIPLSLDNWRRANVNSLISAVYRLCHSKKVVFGISPAANISFDNSHDNYNLLYADTALWMRQEGFIDYILPQLYFGYQHPVEKSRYDYLLNIWSKLPKHKKLKFYIGLGAYRMDENSEDKAEWHNDPTLMARQTVDAINSGADGIAVFSYTASASKKPHNTLQIKNMFEVFE